MEADRSISIDDAFRDPLLADHPVATLQRLAKRIHLLQNGSGNRMRAAKVAFQGGFTTNFLTELMPLFLGNRGIDATIHESTFGTSLTEILDPSSVFWDFGADLVFLLPTQRDLIYPHPAADTSTVDACVEKELAIWHSIWSKLSMPVVQLSFGPGPTRALAEADGLYPGGELHYIREVNRRLVRDAPSHVSFVDTERLAVRAGPSWYDERMYHLTKQPFSMEALPALANALAASASASLGLAKKALIVDLDNTLWGGVIGDDGLDGISLGQETPEGASFVSFQRYLKALSQRGIILCVCSKNEEQIAREPFERHSGMVLQKKDFAVFRANFDDKAMNIRSIAQSLNLGLDTLVFADDSVVECALVKKLLPEVWTIQLEGDPSGFAELLDRPILFPTRRLSTEDLNRTASYRKIEKFRSEIEKTTDIDAFLKSLAPVAIIESVREDTIDRISQLIAKTNQFKLNPTNYSSSEIRDAADHVLAIRFKDQLQDYGIVAVAVTEPNFEKDVLTVGNWVMSCRVFSRRLELFTFELLAERAAKLNISQLHLTYQNSGRNDLVGKLLPALGFKSSNHPNQYSSTPAEVTFPSQHFIERIGQWPSVSSI